MGPLAWQGLSLEMESEERDKYHAFAILDSTGQRLLRLASSERQDTEQWVQVGYWANHPPSFPPPFPPLLSPPPFPPPFLPSFPPLLVSQQLGSSRLKGLGGGLPCTDGGQQAGAPGEHMRGGSVGSGA